MVQSRGTSGNGAKVKGSGRDGGALRGDRSWPGVQPGSLDPYRRKDLARLVLKLGLGDRADLPWELLDLALTHPTAKAQGNYEQLEFFGDAVVRLAAAEFLAETYPDGTVGEWTAIRSQLVSDRALARIAQTYNLDRHLLKAPGTQGDKTGLTTRLANALEALVGALYQATGDLSLVRLWLDGHWASHAEAIRQDPAYQNYKVALQEWTQGRWQTCPVYRVTETDPTHDAPERFTAQVWIQGKFWGMGRGRSTKAAQEAAAREAFLAVQAEDAGANSEDDGRGNGGGQAKGNSVRHAKGKAGGQDQGKAGDNAGVHPQGNHPRGNAVGQAQGKVGDNTGGNAGSNAGIQAKGHSVGHTQGNAGGHTGGTAGGSPQGNHPKGKAGGQAQGKAGDSAVIQTQGNAGGDMRGKAGDQAQGKAGANGGSYGRDPGKGHQPDRPGRDGETQTRKRGGPSGRGGDRPGNRGNDGALDLGLSSGAAPGAAPGMTV